MVKILVVDDMFDIVDELEKFLVEGGYEVIVACDGVEALKCYDAQTNIDLVVTDISMPEMDGLTLARCLKAKGKDIKIVGMSADDLGLKRGWAQGLFDKIFIKSWPLRFDIFNVIIQGLIRPPE